MDRRAVLGPDVVALAHPLGGIVALPEETQHGVVAGEPGIEDRKDHLGVAGAPAAHLFVGGVRREAPRVAHRGGVHAVGLPEAPLCAPEAAHCEDRALQPLEGRQDGDTIHEVPIRHRQGDLPSGEGLLGARHTGIALAQEHDREIVVQEWARSPYEK
jgi:hypothetical protein